MIHLLIVDDEANIVNGLAHTIPWKDIGIKEVFKAYSGQEALEILKIHSIDIMITDIRMPGISGLQLLEEVQRNWKKTKCILLSGYAEFSYAQQAIQHHTVDYLLKPISDEEILRVVENVVTQVRSEREEYQTYQRALKAFHENLPRMRGELLNELLQGRRYSPQQLDEKLDMLTIPMKPSESFALMLVRLEGAFTEKDIASLSIMEYAINNMVEEIFEGSFHVWACKDVHDYLVYLVTVANDGIEHTGAVEAHVAEQFQLLAYQLQSGIKHYLNGSASVLVSSWGTFHQDIHARYQGILTSLRKQLGEGSDWFIVVQEEAEVASVLSLQTLHEPPLLVHLLESSDWKAIREKLDKLFNELGTKNAVSPEYLIEVFFGVYSAFSSFSHKNGSKLEEIIGTRLAEVSGLHACRSVNDLRKWVYQAYEMLKGYMDHEMKNNSETLIKKIQAYVQRHLFEDVSLQAIAESMFMHPVHVSRIYKLETGENLSDYVYRLKMEKAAMLLTNSPQKIYEIALQLGYQNPNYFIKVFKRFYALTPQEYRLKLKESM